MNVNILAINPGSTSTKIAVLQREAQSFETTIRHPAAELGAFETVIDQFEFRKELILKALQEGGVPLASLNAVVGRGGLLRAMKGGTYTINERMLHDLKIGINGQHACNLGGLIAHALSRELLIPCYIVDPPVVDEMDDIARLSGMPGMERESRFHTLNHRAAGHAAAKQLNKQYKDCNFVIAHMGGGISVSAHQKGRVTDTNNGVDSEGSYTPERAGTLPVRALIRMCMSKEHTYEQMCKKTVGEAGLMGYLKTNDAREVVKRVEEGDEYAKLVYEGMCYQIAKEIGAYAVVLKGEIDGICLTGGLAHDVYLTSYIRDMVEFLAPVFIFPGENELRALADGVFRVMDGQEEAKEY
ncbi:butyrate kinase [Christensenellaceae bacterium OttesenSCG-928-M15]|nr:butyrate kinase [Christensenellaceae bacterium OttesenSCG-928-M15]